MSLPLIAHRLQPILISRFLINLRQVDSSNNTTQMAHFSKFSMPNLRIATINDIVGNMGEELEHDPREREEAWMIETEIVTSPSRDSGNSGTRAEFQSGDDYEIIEVCFGAFTH